MQRYVLDPRQVEGEISHAMREMQGTRYQLLTGDMSISSKSIIDDLDADTLLIEYFCVENEILVFLLDADGLRICDSFPSSIREIKQSMQVLDVLLTEISGMDSEYIEMMVKPVTRRQLTWLYLLALP